MNAVAWGARGIERLGPADRPLLDGFQAATFGPDAVQRQPGYRRWLFDEVPHPDPEGIQVWVCKRAGAIVGQQCGIPFRLQAGGEVLRASWAVDLMVTPEWRLRGVGPALSEAHAMASPVTLSLGMTDAAYKSYRRTGWIDLGTIPTWVRPLDLAACRRAGPPAGTLLRAAALVGGPMLAAHALAGGFAGRLAGARLVEVPAFDERSDALWEAARRQHPLGAVRDRAALSWRFDRTWTADGLRRFYVMRGRRAMAFLVLRADPWKGERLAVVLDYLARPGWTAAALALAVEQARRDGMAALLCRTLNTRAVGAFRALAFLRLANGVRMATRAMARIGPGGEPVRALVEQPANWFLTAADSDIGFKPLGA